MLLLHPVCRAVSAMALTASTLLPLGTPLPLALLQQQLTPVSGAVPDAAALADRPVLLLFLCPHQDRARKLAL